MRGVPEMLVNIRDYERAARVRLPRMVYDYYAGGALDEMTLRENRAAWKRIPVWHRALAGVAASSPATTVMGTGVSMPVLVAPTAFHRLADPEGELATARAAAAARTLMIVSTLSNTRIEDIERASDVPLWFQLYIYKDRAVTRDLVRRVEATRCSCIVLTVDAPVLGPRERDVRNHFALPDGLGIQNAMAAGEKVAHDPEGSGLASYVHSFLDPAISWKDLEWLRGITKLPILLKGVVRADDARRAVELGAGGIVVSNHGGRQLDASPATVEALPYVVDAVAGRAEVFVDGGVRRGTDVLKAVALGARAVLVGRPVLWGLAVEGEAGVERVLGILRRELENAMGLAGCATVADITPDLLRPDSR